MAAPLPLMTLRNCLRLSNQRVPKNYCAKLNLERNVRKNFDLTFSRSFHRCCVKLAEEQTNLRKSVNDDSKQIEMESPAVAKPFGDAHQDSLAIDIHQETVPLLQRVNKPFLKNLFIGVFDTDMLTYPEVETNEELLKLENFIKPYTELFDSADSLDFVKRKEIPLEFITAMASVGLFAQGIPDRYGGLELNSTYLTRMAEITGSIPMAHALVEVHHNIAINVIVTHGTESQKQKFLPKLATGELIASLCLNESQAYLDFQSLQTKASVITNASMNDDGFSLSGYKTWVPNANIADLFLVVATAPVEVMGHWEEEGVTLFIVERSRSGIDVLERIESLESPRGLPLFNVAFNQVHLTKDDILGAGGEGDLATIAAMTHSGHHIGAAYASLLKKFTNMLQNFLVKEQIGEVPLYENPSYQAILAELQCTAYVMESMAYMTGQIADEFSEPDLSLEKAATRVWCVEELHSILASVMEVMGIGSMEKEHPICNAFLDTLASKNYPIPIELLKQYIALSGIRHAASQKDGIIRGLRDRLNNPGSFMKRILALDDIRPLLTLHRHVHEILGRHTNELENLCYSFDKAMESYLCHGPKTGSILTDQLELSRVAWIVSQLYAMTAVISHASRSVCIGIKSQDIECIMAQHFVRRLAPKVQAEIIKLGDHEHCHSDYYRQMAKDIIEAKGYMSSHPLTRNY